MTGVFDGIGQAVGGVVGGVSSGVVTGLPGAIQGGIKGGAEGATFGAAAGAGVGAVGGVGVGDPVTIPAGTGLGAATGGLVGSSVGAATGFAPGFSQGYAQGAPGGAAVGGGYGQYLDDTWLGRKINAMVKGNEQADKSNSQNQGGCVNGCGPPSKKSGDDVLSDKTRDKKKPTLKDGSDQYRGTGGMDQANEDFNSMHPGNVQDKGGGVRTGTLDDGTEVKVRPESQPTVEINPPGHQGNTIRYD